MKKKTFKKRNPLAKAVTHIRPQTIPNKKKEKLEKIKDNELKEE